MNEKQTTGYHNQGIGIGMISSGVAMILVKYLFDIDYSVAIATILFGIVMLLIGEEQIMESF